MRNTIIKKSSAPRVSSRNFFPSPHSYSAAWQELLIRLCNQHGNVICSIREASYYASKSAASTHQRFFVFTCFYSCWRPLRASTFLGHQLRCSNAARSQVPALDRESSNEEAILDSAFAPTSGKSSPSMTHLHPCVGSMTN